MSQELLYTSAPTGLKSGSRGFSTVLCTAGMAPNIATRLETLSGYRHVFSPQDSQASLNPISWSHLRLAINGQPASILSRIAAFGVDYSGRTNKLAHHVVPPPAEMAKAGPAWMLLQSAWVRTDWDGTCQTSPTGPALPSGNQPLAICKRWQQLSGDAGWGGVLAETISAPTSKPLWIIFSIDQSPALLELINESIALLPVSERWRATFSTYYTNLPPEIDCKIRCVLAGTEEAKLAPARGRVIDLTQTLAKAPQSAYVEAARTGVVVASPISQIPVHAGVAPTSHPVPPKVNASTDDLWPDELLLLPPINVGKLPAVATANMPNLPPKLPSSSFPSGGKRRITWAMGTSGVVLVLLLLAAVPIIYATKKRADQITELASHESKPEQYRQSQIAEQPMFEIKHPAQPSASNENESSGNILGMLETKTSSGTNTEKLESPGNEGNAGMQVDGSDSSHSNDSMNNDQLTTMIPSPKSEQTSTQEQRLDHEKDIGTIDNNVMVVDVDLGKLIDTNKINFTFDKETSHLGAFHFIFTPIISPSPQKPSATRALETSGTTSVDSRNEIRMSRRASNLNFMIDFTKNESTKSLISNAILTDKYVDNCISFLNDAFKIIGVNDGSIQSISKAEAYKNPENLQLLLQTAKKKLEERFDAVKDDPQLSRELNEINQLLPQDSLANRLKKIEKEIQDIPEINLGRIDFFIPASALTPRAQDPVLSVPLRFKLEVKD